MPNFNSNPENFNVIAMPVIQAAAVDEPVASFPVAPETSQEVAVEKNTKKLSKEQIEQMLSNFNAQLDSLCSHFDIKITDEDMKICPNTNIDHLLSFETKVNYVCEFFEGKHIELTDKIIGSK